MSFFDRAQSGYERLAGRADDMLDRTGPQQVGDVDRTYRDLGMLAYLVATGRPVDEGARAHLVEVLRSMEERGAIREFLLADGRPAAGRGGPPPPPPKPGGSDGIPTPPPERAGRHGSFLTQSRPGGPTPPPPQRHRDQGPDEDTTPPSTWGV